MSRFNRIALATVLGLGLAVAVLSIAMARLGPAVDSFSTASLLDGTLVGTEIQVTFTEPMRLKTVESNFHVTPNTPGIFSWSGDEMLYIPRHNLRYQTHYTVTIGTGAQDAGGRSLLRTYQARFTTQGQHLMYLGTAGRERGRLMLASVNGKRSVLGPDDGLVTDYSLSPDRTLAVYVQRGSSGERPDELWLVSLQDGSTQQLFRRADWTMTQPRLSPDGHYIAFLATNVLLCRQYYGCYRDRSSPIIELFDLHSKHAFQFHSTVVPITDFLDFSPAGQLAFTDLGSALTLANPNGSSPIHIPNSGNALQFAGFDPTGARAAFVGQTSSSIGGDILVYDHSKYRDISAGIYDSSTPSFSSSGAQVAYSAYRGERGIEPVYGINIYSLKTGRTEKLTAEKRWTDWAPAWSLNGKYVAFVRSAAQEAMYLGSGEVWVAGTDGKQAWALGGIGKQVGWVS